MDDIQDRIAWNSALNNAVDLVGATIASHPTGGHTDEWITKEINRWQAIFYQNLTNRKKPEQKKVNTAKVAEDVRTEVGNEELVHHPLDKEY